MLTYGTIREATNTEAVTAFLEEHVLAATEWHLARVRRRNVRLDPPVSYTALYRVTIGGGDCGAAACITLSSSDQTI